MPATPAAGLRTRDGRPSAVAVLVRGHVPAVGPLAVGVGLLGLHLGVESPAAPAEPSTWSIFADDPLSEGSPSSGSTTVSVPLPFIDARSPTSVGSDGSTSHSGLFCLFHHFQAATAAPHAAARSTTSRAARPARSRRILRRTSRSISAADTWPRSA